MVKVVNNIQRIIGAREISECSDVCMMTNQLTDPSHRVAAPEKNISKHYYMKIW